MCRRAPSCLGTPSLGPPVLNDISSMANRLKMWSSPPCSLLCLDIVSDVAAMPVQHVISYLNINFKKEIPE